MINLLLGQLHLSPKLQLFIQFHGMVYLSSYTASHAWADTSTWSTAKVEFATLCLRGLRGQISRKKGHCSLTMIDPCHVNCSIPSLCSSFNCCYTF